MFSLSLAFQSSDFFFQREDSVLTREPGSLDKQGTGSTLRTAPEAPEPQNNKLYIAVVFLPGLFGFYYQKTGYWGEGGGGMKDLDPR